jgi:NADP-dependent 3-hydroxy acid dehydrogenase YdfG
MRELRGKTAVVTGAASGIGAAIAKRLRDEGCRVALVDAAALGAGEAPDVTTHRMDVSDARAWEAFAAEVRDAHGGADLLVNNAGITIHGAFADQSLDDLDRIVDVNLKGVLYGCRAFLPQLRAHRAGHVVNVSSLAGRVAFPYQSSYCATKFAVRGFSAALRMELSECGVGVTAVLPGTVATRLLDAARTYDRGASQRLTDLMLRHGARPERVADRVVRAIQRDEAEVLIGWDARIATGAHSLAPSALYGALSMAFRARRTSRTD